jgi:hypothetical protein
MREEKGLAWAELALVDDHTTRRPHAFRRLRDVGGVNEPETEMRHVAGASAGRLALEHEDVASARGLRLHEIWSAKDGDHSENGFVERKSSLDVLDAEGDMRETVRGQRRW